jgi:uncharacterized protein (DUF433 family)
MVYSICMQRQLSALYCDPEILGGAPIFRGTRVSGKALLDYLQAGHSVEEFLDDFPSVTRKHVEAVLDEA